MVAPVAVREQATQRAHRGDEQDCDDEQDCGDESDCL
jgi:hypothetical protein